MRAILLILILAIVAAIAAIATGLVNVSQTQGAKVPTVEANDGSIRAEPGQVPRFDVETGSVGVGTREANVAVPKVEVKRDQATVAVPTVEVRPPKDAQQNAAR
jgi:hypothetical protein